MSRSRGRSRAVPRFSTLAAGTALAVAAASTITACGASTDQVRTGAVTRGPLDIKYHTVSSWDTGDSGQYTITTDGTTAVSGWTLAFTLPADTSVASLWNGSYKHTAGQVLVTSESWDAAIAPGHS